MAGNAGRSAPDPTFLEDFTPLYYQNLNIKYGYVRMRANATVLVTDVRAHSFPSAAPVPPLHALLPGCHACMPPVRGLGTKHADFVS